MNPLFMMFGPIGFMGGGCGCGVNMPFYGQNDMLTFMNFPVFRNTSMDYLLDPRLAMMQAQQSFYYGGGSIFGNTMLPMFNNFPGMNNMPWSNNMAPWWTQQNSETPEQRKAREAREKEENKPENAAKKAQIDDCKECFNKFKSIIDEDIKNSTEFKQLEADFKKALEEEKIDDRLAKLKEVMSSIDDEKFIQIALSDSDIDTKLYKIGYNFSSGKYNHKQSELETTINNFIVELKLSDSVAVGKLASVVKDHKDYILNIVSTLNDTHKTDAKGILRGLAKNLPDDDKQVSYNTCIEAITNALIVKADSFIRENGGAASFPKLSAQLNAVEKAITSDVYKNLSFSAKKSKINALADEFDKLYAMLRVQEAKVLNKKVVSKYAEKMNAMKEGVIPEDIIIKETTEDLKSENIAVPTDEQLDELPKKGRGFTVKIQQEDIDKKYKDNPQGLLDEYLAKDNKYLTKTENSEIYQTKAYDQNGSGIKYFTVKDKKLVEVVKNDDGLFDSVNDDESVSAKSIEAYDSTITRINNLLNTNAIEPVEKIPNLFKSTGADEYYALVGNTFGKVKSSVDLATANEIKESDLEAFNDDDVKSKEKVKKEEAKKADLEKNEKAAIHKIEQETFGSLTEAKDRAKELGYRETCLADYFVIDGKNGQRYYLRYQDGKLVLQEGVTGVKSNGQIKKNGVWTAAETDLSPSDLGVELRRKLRNDTTSDEYDRIDQILSVFETYTKADDIIEFIEAYTKQKDSESPWTWNNSLCSQISSENDYGAERKTRALQIIAKQVKRVMEMHSSALGGYGITSEEYEDMKFAAESTNSDSTSWRKDGNRFLGLNWFGKGWSFFNSSRTGFANHMDDIIDRLVADYNEKVKGKSPHINEEA